MPRSGNTKHTPVLYPHPEIGDGEGHTPVDGSVRAEYPRQHSAPSAPAPNKPRIKSRTANSYPPGLIPTPPPSSVGSLASDDIATAGPPRRGEDVYSRFTRKYRPGPADHDPDTNYFQRGLGQLNDPEDSNDESSAPPGITSSTSAATPHGQPVTEYSHEVERLSQAERERLEWQTMLAFVLDGDVFRSEKTRIVRALETVEARNNARQNIWLGIRAWLRGRTDSEELQRLEFRRTRVVGAIYDEVMSFRAITEPDPRTGLAPEEPIVQVQAILERYDTACSLYPSLRAMREDKPACASPEFLNRIESLISWGKLYVSLQRQVHTLQFWIGSETIDFTPPNVSNGSSEGRERLDGFMERILKEDSLQRTFERGALVVINTLIESTRRVIAIRFDTFQELNLPSFERDLILLISFPTKLMEASLRIRLDAASRVKDPNMMVLDTLTDDFRLAIALACTVKREYEVLIAEDIEGHWKLPPCIPKGYDSVLLQSLLLFFKLLHWKLKSGAKGIHFKETEVLDAQEDIMDEVSMTIEGGAALIAEQLCGLTNRLIHRVINYFETQMQVPVAVHRGRSRMTQARGKGTDREERGAQAELSSEHALVWLGKVLESVRLRYRKLQRYARSLTQRFSNSAEYSLENINIEHFIRRLTTTDHFLVYTDVFEENGLYVVASAALRGRPRLIRDILLKAYNVRRPTPDNYESSEADDYDEPAYLLILSPSDPFMWQGFVMMLTLPEVDLNLEVQRVRLVADGTQARLAVAKSHFTSVFLDDTSDSSSTSDSDENHDDSETARDRSQTPVHLHCIIEQQAHLPNVNRELRKISRATNKLAETIVCSVNQVREALQGSEGYQELLENWYTFASDHGQHAQKHIEPGSFSRFARMLTKLAISWVAFICDDCDPTDRKTFRWAVTALEFAMTRTHGTNILHLPDDEFALLRQKVATCMTLLISHFDILGARSSYEASKEQERLAELRRMEGMMNQSLNGGGVESRPVSPVSETIMENQSLRLRWKEPLSKMEELEARRCQAGSQQRSVGRVVDEEKLEDKSLLFLASSTSNISIRWQQGRFIGSGAFGSVYLAVNLDSGGLMAAKEIKFQDMTHLSNLYQQIKDELSVMEILQHPNIVEYYGIEVHRDRVFIFEEYCPGGSLATLLEHGRIEDESVLQVYTMQMLDGLAYLHSQGVVHRDIKPDNVLLDHLGVIKFVDFGASKIFTKGHHKTMGRHGKNAAAPLLDPSARRPSHSLTGTPMYMSPEIIKNDHHGRHGAMDIWSLGCVVLECATGRKPWSQNLDNEWAIMFQIGQADRAPQLPDPSQLSSLGIHFVKRCLTLDPMTRPTAEDMLNHSWMQAFRNEMESYDHGSDSYGARPSTPGGSNTDDLLSPGEE